MKLLISPRNVYALSWSGDIAHETCLPTYHMSEIEPSTSQDPCLLLDELLSKVATLLDASSESWIYRRISTVEAPGLLTLLGG